MTDVEWLWTVEAKTNVSAIEEPVGWPAVGRHRADAKQSLLAALPHDQWIVEWGETYV